MTARVDEAPRARIVVDDTSDEFGPLGEMWMVQTYSDVLERWTTAWSGLSYGEAKLMYLRMEARGP